MGSWVPRPGRRTSMPVATCYKDDSTQKTHRYAADLGDGASYAKRADASFSNLARECVRQFLCDTQSKAAAWVKS